MTRSIPLKPCPCHGRSGHPNLSVRSNDIPRLAAALGKLTQDGYEWSHQIPFLRGLFRRQGFGGGHSVRFQTVSSWLNISFPRLKLAHIGRAPAYPEPKAEIEGSSDTNSAR